MGDNSAARMTDKEKQLILTAFARVLGRRYIDGLPEMVFTSGDIRLLNKARQLVLKERTSEDINRGTIPEYKKEP